MEYRAVIRYLFLNGNTPTQIKEEIYTVYGDSSPSFISVKFWPAKFKRGRSILDDDERSGRPKTATTKDNIAKIHQMVLTTIESRLVRHHGLLAYPKKRVYHILKQDLDMHKLAARRVPHLLTLDRKRGISIINHVPTVMKSGFIITAQKHKDSQNSGLRRENRLQK
ncbi:protein GVQW3-like [Stegodyphus dumicola]|uniref:protein GVQW3-like n=1 Tax=Stegodyphus dumicola TaxID=202533 RepID=UPI0015A7BD98|nr:protein GVQW3-like [Stegodyphus dumicola]